MDGENWGQVDDEFCHAHSEQLRKTTERLEKQGRDRQRIVEFSHFAWREDSSVLPVVGAIFATGTRGDAGDAADGSVSRLLLIVYAR